MPLAPDRPDAPDSPPPAPPSALPSALPAAGWVVGAGAVAPPSSPDPVTRQAARLEARLAVYAHHAAAVAEQAAATLAGDLVRADVLAREREAAAEHFGELQAPAGGALVAVPSFGSLLTDALTELEHQAAVDLALRQRLVALRDAVSRGAAWASGGEPLALPSGAPAEPAEPVDPPDDVPTRALEGGWVAARADGVVRMLGGHFPGAATRGDAAAALAAVERAGDRSGDRPGERMEQEGDGAEGAGHVDLRF